MKLYTLTKAHEKKLKPWADKWIKNGLSTKPMDEKDKKAMRKAIKGMYRAAGLKELPDNRIIFVPSPFVGRFASGFAAAIWYMRKNPSFKTTDATNDATYNATYNATNDATDNATYNATYNATANATNNATNDATRNATNNATYNATYNATNDATDNATNNATNDATRNATANATYNATANATYNATYNATANATANATYNATANATRNATANATDDSLTLKFKLDVKSLISLSYELGLGKFGLCCAKESWRFVQGGNFWSRWVAYISFFRYVAKLKIDYSKWDHLEKAAVHGSYRYMHEEFCMISDRPRKLMLDEQNRGHNFDGTYIEWSDGTGIYMIHGIEVPAWICETKRENFTKKMIAEEQNADYRRCIIQKIGIERAINLLGAEVIDTYKSKIGGKYELLSVDYDGRGKRPYLKMWNKSIKAFHIEGVRPNTKTVKEALMYRNGLTEFAEPMELT